MEVLHNVSLAVIVAVAAVVHQDPHAVVHLVELSAATVSLRHGHKLPEEFLLARFGVQVRGAHLVVTEPQQSMTVEEHVEHRLARRLPDHLGSGRDEGDSVDGTLTGGSIERIGMHAESSHFFLRQYCDGVEGHRVTDAAIDTLGGS